MHGTDVFIRTEREGDLAVIDKLLHEAFGGIQEAQLVHQIRKSQEYIPSLSFVAVRDEVIVGHLMFSLIQLLTDSGESHQILSLAPVCVDPQYQKNGIGSTLIRYGLSEAKKLAYPLIVVIGHEEYYPKFGFVVAKQFGLRLKYPIPENAFFVMELHNEFLQNREGTIEFPQYFDEAM